MATRYNNETGTFKLSYPDSGEESSAAAEEQIRNNIEWPLEVALMGLAGTDMDATVYDGFAVSAGAGLSINVAAGRGIIGGLVIYASSSTAKSGLSDNSTIYIYLKKTATTKDDRTFTVETSAVGTGMADAILIAKVTTSGGSVTAVDNDPPNRAPRIPASTPGIPTLRVVGAAGAEYSDPKAAIEDCNAGDIVLITAGTYNISSTITVPADNITIMGTSRDGCVLNFTAGDATSCLNLNGKDGISVSRLTIQAVSGHTGKLIDDGAGVSDLALRDVHVSANNAPAIYFNSPGSRVSIDHCRIATASPDMMRFQNVSHLSITRCLLTCSATGASTYALMAQECPDLTVAHNRIEMTGAAPEKTLYFRECDRAELADNTIVVTNPVAAGIYVYLRAGSGDAHYYRAHHNTIVGAGDVGDGIRLDRFVTSDLIGCLVDHNIIVDFNVGIRINDAQVLETRVRGNVVYTCTTGISDAGTGTVSTDNT